MTDTMTRPATAPVAVPLEPTTPIKPSEALRLGRLVRPEHAHFMYLDGGTAACAVGAIHVGWGGSDTLEYEGAGLPVDLYDTIERFPEWAEVSHTYERTETVGGDGDAAVLAYLEERGL